MGLLDWLTSDIGSDGGGVPSVNPMGDATGTGMPPPDPGATPPPVPPMPPPQRPTGPPIPPMSFQRPEFASPPMPPDGSIPAPASMGAAAPPMPPGSDPIPLPMARPAAASLPPTPPGGHPGPSALPPGSTPTSGAGMPPGPPLSLQPPAGGDTPGPNGALNPSGSFLGRALGLDSNKEKSMFGSLGAGLTAAGNSKGKSKGQALFSGAGGAIEGGIKAEDKSYDQRLKSLQIAVQAQSAGDKAAYNVNYAKYLSGKLKAETDKAASGGKSGAWNKPDSQKFIDAQNALAKDPDIRASQKLLEQAAKDGDPNAVAAAKASHDALVKQKQSLYLTGVGLNPQQIQKNMQTPPGTRENPHTVTSQQDFDRYVKPGEVYINPKDGKPYVRKGAGDGASDSAAAETAPSTTPAPPGPIPGTSSESADESEEL